MKMVNLKWSFVEFVKNRQRFFSWVLYLFYFLFATWLFTPPQFLASHGLDPSWVWGLNESVGQKLLFGRDIIWTYGPYGLMLAPLGNFASYWQTIILCGYVAFSFALASLLIFKKHWYGILLMITGVMSPQTLYMCYPFLAGIWIVKAHLENHDVGLRKKMLLTVVLLFPFGLLFLIKGSLLAVCLGVWLVAQGCALLRKNYLTAGIYLMVFPLSVLVFWLIAGQPLGNLVMFFKGNSEMIAGFTEAMAIHRRSDWEPIVFALVSLGLLCSVFCNRNAPVVKILLALVLFFFLFSAFKAGFVRHDMHMQHALAALIMATGLLPFINTTSSMEKRSWLIPACLLANLYIIFNYAGSITSRTHIYNRKNCKNQLKECLNNLKTTAILPCLPGTADIYPTDISMLMASGNNYNPRPVLQSYSAYTPYLINANVNHLLGENAPDNLFFAIKTIDGRMFSLGDGASWPVIFSRYRPVKMIKEFLVLQKAEPRKLAESTLLKITGQFGETVMVPKSDGLIFVKLKIRQTWLGKLARVIFKPTTLHITVSLENGRQARYRIISTMTETGFLLSPLVTNTREFAALYSQSKTGETVTAFSIDANHGRYQWRRDYEIEFSRLESPAIHLPRDAELVYVLSSTADLKNSHDIGRTEVKGQSLILQATGGDPHFSLPVNFERGYDYAVVINARGASHDFQLFYTTVEQANFKEQDSIDFFIVPERDVCIELPKGNEFYKLRLDPGRKSGEYVIEKLQVLRTKRPNNIKAKQ